MKITESDKKRFWNKVDKLGADDCWEWQACKSSYGYGQLNLSGKIQYAHRISWELANKQDIPKNMDICHRCDNPPCVNPSHLFLGTRADNQRDSWNKGRNSNTGQNNSKSVLTNEQVILFKRHIAEAEFDRGDKKLFCIFWGKKFGVNYHTLESIMFGYNWTHIKV